MSEMPQKPKLVSMKVPWLVSSVPKETLFHDKKNSQLLLDFIAYFKLHPIENKVEEGLYVVPTPPPFRSAHEYERKPYHVVRLIFDGLQNFERFWNISDHEIIPESEYDWTLVPLSEMKPEETIEENVQAAHAYWMRTGFAADPGFLQILQPDQGPDDEIDMKHYFWFGMDESLRISAQSWRWELGQSVK